MSTLSLILLILGVTLLLYQGVLFLMAAAMLSGGRCTKVKYPIFPGLIGLVLTILAVAL